MRAARPWFRSRKRAQRAAAKPGQLSPTAKERVDDGRIPRRFPPRPRSIARAALRIASLASQGGGREDRVVVPAVPPSRDREAFPLTDGVHGGRDRLADRGEPALVHGRPRSRPGELPGPDPGVRARLDVGGGSARDPARELPPADEKRGSGRPGALAEGHDRGGGGATRWPDRSRVWSTRPCQRRRPARSTCAWLAPVATRIRCWARRCGGSSRTRPFTWPSTVTS